MSIHCLSEPAVLRLHKRKCAGVLCAALLPVLPVHAGHPQMSEDTGTQGAGNFELELGQDWSRVEGTRSYLFQPQLSYGTTAAFDLILQPSWFRNTDSAGAVTTATGDTNLDFKWRFFGAAPLTLGVRAGLELPTAGRGLGLPAGRIGGHSVLVATFDSDPWSLDFNAGYSRVSYFPGARPDLYHASAAVLYAVVDQRLYLVVDSAADTNPDPAEPSTMGVALLAFIYTVRAGFDIDAGFRAPLNAGAPTQQWLIGITWRGAL